MAVKSVSFSVAKGQVFGLLGKGKILLDTADRVNILSLFSLLSDSFYTPTKKYPNDLLISFIKRLFLDGRSRGFNKSTETYCTSF